MFNVLASERNEVWNESIGLCLFLEDFVELDGFGDRESIDTNFWVIVCGESYALIPSVDLKNLNKNCIYRIFEFYLTSTLKIRKNTRYIYIYQCVHISISHSVIFSSTTRIFNLEQYSKRKKKNPFEYTLSTQMFLRWINVILDLGAIKGNNSYSKGLCTLNDINSSQFQFLTVSSIARHHGISTDCKFRNNL